MKKTKASKKDADEYAERVSKAALEVLYGVLYAVKTPAEAMEVLLNAMVGVTIVMSHHLGKDDSEMVLGNMRQSFDAAKDPENRKQFLQYADAGRTGADRLCEAATKTGDPPREDEDERLQAGLELGLYLAATHTNGPHEAMEALKCALVSVVVKTEDTTGDDVPGMTLNEFRSVRALSVEHEETICKRTRETIDRGIQDRNRRRTAN